MTEIGIKALIRKRDGYACTKCGMTNADHIERHNKQLHVHRTKPGSEYTLKKGACVTLCFGCHGSEPKRPAGSVERRGDPRKAFHLDDELAGAFAQFLEATRPRVSESGCLRVALEEFLAKRGYWKIEKKSH